MTTATFESREDLVLHVQRLIEERVTTLPLPAYRVNTSAHLMPGKMLRTRLAGRLIESGSVRINSRSLERLCAATEMTHTASLCHDDVIDGGLVRRHMSALWRITSPSAAVLIGDMLLCEAMDLVLGTEGGRYVGRFVSRIREVCAAEAEQELMLRGKQLNEYTCLRLARGKTGPLFAFVAYVCGSDDGPISLALEEAGYLIGTAYQLADDLLDAVGNEQAAGKTLRADRRRRKFTIHATSQESRGVVQKYISECCSAALDSLDSWPLARAAVQEFFVRDLQPLFERCVPCLELTLKHVV